MRLQSLCKELNRPVLASREFAKMMPEIWTSLGQHALRGLRAPREVFALDEERLADRLAEKART